MSILGSDGNPARPKIYKDLVELRKKVGNLEAKQRQGVMFKVKDAAELTEKVRAAADELGMVMAGSVVDQSFNFYAPIEGVSSSGKPQITLIVHCKSTVRFMSDDGSFADFVGSGHGSGTDDKSGGKASTYAQKDAVLKALMVPNNAIPDTDDENVPLARGVVPKPAVSFEAVMDSIHLAKSKAELEECKLLAKTAKLSPANKAALSAAFVEKQAKVY